MNSHLRLAISLPSLLRTLVHNHELIYEMTRRDVIGRYKGSMLGLIWAIANPILLLITYTFVFSVVFHARWGSEDPKSTSQFASLLFIGMIIHNLFSETLMRAPSLIVANTNYVKKIVFPLEILPVVVLGTSLFHAMISLTILVISLLALTGTVSWTILYLPVVLFPLILLSLGFAWMLASLGVFLRDVSQPIGLAMTALLFFSPVFYPATALPEHLRPWLMINPLTFIIEQARAVIFFGRAPQVYGLLLYAICSVIIAWLGYVWFQKTRKGFANVL